MKKKNNSFAELSLKEQNLMAFGALIGLRITNYLFIVYSLFNLYLYGGVYHSCVVMASVVFTILVRIATKASKDKLFEIALKDDEYDSRLL